MLTLNVNSQKRERFRILCLGAHSDDIEIGCGGTLLKLLSSKNNIEVRWVVYSGGANREGEARRSAALFLKDARLYTVVTHEFRESFFPYCGEQIKEAFEKIKEQYSPDLIFTHFRDDRHQDHHTIGELTWNTFRVHGGNVFGPPPAARN